MTGGSGSHRRSTPGSRTSAWYIYYSDSKSSLISIIISVCVSSKSSISAARMPNAPIMSLIYWHTCASSFLLALVQAFLAFMDCIHYCDDLLEDCNPDVAQHIVDTIRARLLEQAVGPMLMQVRLPALGTCAPCAPALILMLTAKPPQLARLPARSC